LDHKRHGFASFPFIRSLIGLKGEIWLGRFLDNLANVLPIKTFCSDIIMVAEKK
jgi:hypothetical protein